MHAGDCPEVPRTSSPLRRPRLWAGNGSSSPSFLAEPMKRPTSAVAYKRPISQYARVAMAMGVLPQVQGWEHFVSGFGCVPASGLWGRILSWPRTRPPCTTHREARAGGQLSGKTFHTWSPEVQILVQSPQRPPPPTAHTSLAASTALLPTTVFDHECVRPPVPLDPRERAANPGSPRYSSGCLHACAYVGGEGTPAGMPLLALSLLYLIPVICSWSSVPLGKEPWPEPAMLTAQPPPLLTLDPPAPIRPHSPSGQLPAEGKTQVPMAIFSIWLAPESPSPPMPPRSSSWALSGT